MKRYVALSALLVLVFTARAQQADQELNRDAVIGWQYVANLPNPKAVYSPVKSEYGGGAAYSVLQQRMADLLLGWVQRSYLPKGLVIRTIPKNDQRWHLYDNGPLHSYGFNLLGYSAHFVNGKIDLSCCEQGIKLIAGFNDFPGAFIKGFNPGGLYFFAERAQFSSGDDEARLSSEGVDKKIQSNLYGYRTYLGHYHDNGAPFNKIEIVIPKNGEWPFKPVLVKYAVAYINQQLAAWPSILQKNPYSVEPIKKALERLKPYYNEVVKLKGNANFGEQIHDDNGHAVLDPSAIINGNPPDKTFPEYFTLVTTTQQTINQTKTDSPLWAYFNFNPPKSSAIKGNLAQFDEKFGTDVPHMIYSLVHNFNFAYVANWIAQPEKMKDVAYTPLNVPTTPSGNTIAVPVSASATALAKSKDPNAILYEDFDGYATGPLSAKGWHTYGRDGHSFENAALSKISGQGGKWVAIPDVYTFYPDFSKPLGGSFTVDYDVYFDNNVQNNRSSLYFRLDTKDPKKSNPIDLHDINREGFQFALAMSGETETSKRFMSVSSDEVIGKMKVPAFKANSVAHVSIVVKGTMLSVTVNGKEVMHDDKLLPAGKAFKRYGWYCGNGGIYLGNIYIKSN